MLKEERSLRTRLAAGSKRRIARRTSDEFSTLPAIAAPPLDVAARGPGRLLDRNHEALRPYETAPPRDPRG
jgi:hypothetical protein